MEVWNVHSLTFSYKISIWKFVTMQSISDLFQDEVYIVIFSLFLIV